MKRLVASVSILVATMTVTGAVSRLPSADGQFWDIQDTSPWAQDSGGIATGGRATERMSLPVWVFIFLPLVALVVVPTLAALADLAR